jgi:hypothetical protein
MLKLLAYQHRFLIGRLGSTSVDLDFRVCSALQTYRLIFEYSCLDFVTSSWRRVPSIRQREDSWWWVESWKWKRKFGCRMAWYVLLLLGLIRVLIYT